MIYNCFVILIQKCYRGYKNRQKLNNLFKPLSRDLQCLILYYLKETYYIDKYNKSISNVLSCRVQRALNDYSNPTLSQNITDDYLYDSYYYKFINMYDLFSKYFEIVDEYYAHSLYTIIAELWNILNNQIRNGTLINETQENLTVSDKWIPIYENLYRSMTNYNIIYNENFSDYKNRNGIRFNYYIHRSLLSLI